MNKSQSSPAQIHAVLWDLDGTIMDSQEGILASMRHTLTFMDCALPEPEDLFTWIGPSFPTSLRRFTALTDAGVTEAVRVYGAFYDAHGAAMATPFPGVSAVIHKLHDIGVPLGLATSKPRTAALKMVESIGLLDLFVARGCASDDETRGTKVEVMSDAIAELAPYSLATQQMLMIGDRIHDFEAAEQLGVRSVAVGWGYGSAEERSQANFQVATVDDLENLFATTVAA